MDKESKKRKWKTPAQRRNEESNSSRTPRTTESIDDNRQRKRKRVEDDSPNKMNRVSEEAGPSTSCQDQNRTVRRPKRNREGQGPSSPAKRKKKEKKKVLTKESGKRNPKRKAEDREDRPTRKKMKKTETQVKADSQRAEFQEKYVELHELGQGGFGAVFAGYRVKGKLPVAIKHIPKDNVWIKHRDENGREIAAEVAVMLKLRTIKEAHSAMVSLLDWYDLEQELILVMERPMFANDFLTYLKNYGGYLDEMGAKMILKQLVEAAIYLQKANIFHRDIKLDNIMIESDSEDLRIYLIDFGLSCFDDGQQHEYFCGTPDMIPLDWYVNSNYRAEPTTVWQLGVVLYEVIHSVRFNTRSFVTKEQRICQWLTEECQDFLGKCLMFDPDERPTLEELLSHPWFS